MKQIKIDFFSLIKYLFLISLFVITVFPLVYTVLASFKSNMEIMTAGTTLFPKKWSYENYINAWNLANFKLFTFNSLFLSFFVVLGTIITCTMSAYVFQRGRFIGRKLILGIMIGTMFMAAGTLYLYPQVEVARFLQINRSLWGVIIVRVFGMNISLLYITISYLKTIPKELDEAAKIDGCGFGMTFWRIIFPLLRPVIATIGLLSFNFAWNDYLLPFVFTIGNPKATPLVVGIVNLKNSAEGSTAYNLMFAGASMSVVPMVIVYFFLNKQFISGLTTGSVKG